MIYDALWKQRGGAKLKLTGLQGKSPRRGGAHSKTEYLLPWTSVQGKTKTGAGTIERIASGHFSLPAEEGKIHRCDSTERKGDGDRERIEVLGRGSERGGKSLFLKRKTADRTREEGGKRDGAPKVAHTMFSILNMGRSPVVVLWGKKKATTEFCGKGRGKLPLAQWRRIE